MTTTSTSRLRRGALAACAAAGLLAVAGAAPAFAAPAQDTITEHGGATRNDGDQTEALRASIAGSDAKNVIFLIGDGMGDSEITVARNYIEGAGGEFAGIDALPLTGQYTTYAIHEDGSPNYASESASTASAWSTGTKTVNGRLSVDVDNAPQSTLLELAKANGKATGNVSTAEIQDATPGAQVAHISARGCYGPEEATERCADEALENGGPGSITEQLLDVRPDVTLGGGAASFAQEAAAGDWQGETLRDQAAARGYQLVDDAAGLAGVEAADQTAPLLGLFADGNLPVRWQGPDATVGGGDLDPVRCQDNPERLDAGLSLASMTDRAIDLLGQQEDGFFLQVEGASIDKENHAANVCGQIGETLDLDEAVHVALEFAKADGDTLVVVTADHAHTSQIVGSTPPGLSASLLTNEGQPMIVAYGTAPEGASQQHTGSQVRIAGYGPGAANVVGLTDQTDLFFTGLNALGLPDGLAGLSGDAALAAGADEVAPGDTLAVTASGFNADWRLAAEGGAEALDSADVIDGGASFEVTAPAEPGPFAVTVAGAQSGETATLELAVAEGAPPVPAPSDGGEGGAGAGDADGDDQAAGAAAAGGSGPLASTGAQAAGAALLAALLLAAGAALVARRRAARIA